MVSFKPVINFEERVYLDKLTVDASPWSLKIDQENRDLLEQAIYHITGDKILPDAHFNQLFGWIKLNRHPVTGVVDKTKEYDVMAYFGDGFEEILKGNKEPMPLLWRRTEEPTIIFDENNDIQDVINNIVRVYSERRPGSDDKF